MSKKIIVFFSCLFLLSWSPAGTPIECHTIITNLENKRGNIYLGVYDNAADYMDSEKAIVKKIIAVDKQSSVTINLGELKTGKYAVVVFLDTNNNGELDTNIFGIPKEKYGFSGSVKPMFRAPNFEEAAVVINSENTTVTVKLN